MRNILRDLAMSIPSDTPVGMGRDRVRAQQQQQQQQQAMLAYLAPDASPEQKAQAAAILASSGAVSLKDLQPKPLNAPNVQFNPTTGEIMVTQYDPNTNQLNFLNPGGAPQGGGVSLSDLATPAPAPATSGQPSPTTGMTPKARAEYETSVAKGRGEQLVSNEAKEAGAVGFKEKVDTVRALVNKIGTETGTIEGSPLYQWGARTAGTSTQNDRDRLKGLLADLELDVAAMQLKGQGAVTESEREIARNKLPKLTNNYDANIGVLNDLEKQANDILGIKTKTPSPSGTPPKVLMDAGITQQDIEEYKKIKGIR